MTCNLATSDKCNHAECTSNCLNQCPAALWWSHLHCLIHPPNPFLGLSDSINLCREWSAVLTTGISPWMSGSSHHRANKNSETQKTIRIHRNDDKMQCFSLPSRLGQPLHLASTIRTLASTMHFCQIRKELLRVPSIYFRANVTFPSGKKPIPNTEDKSWPPCATVATS